MATFRQINLDRTKWSTLKVAIRDYFCPSDFKCCAQDKLASVRQKNSINGYTDAFKHCCAKIPSITDKEMLDRFIRGLSPDVQRELLKQDPPTFAAACQMAERLARLEAVIEACLPSTNQKPKRKQITLHKQPISPRWIFANRHSNVTAWLPPSERKPWLTLAELVWPEWVIPSTNIRQTLQHQLSKIKTAMQLCAITVVDVDILWENATVIQPTSVVVTFRAGIDMVVSSLSLAFANNMADWTQLPIQASCPDQNSATNTACNTS